MLLAELFRLLKLVFYLRLMLHFAYYSINVRIFLVVFGKSEKYFENFLTLERIEIWSDFICIQPFIYTKILSEQIAASGMF